MKRGKTNEKKQSNYNEFDEMPIKYQRDDDEYYGEIDEVPKNRKNNYEEEEEEEKNLIRRRKRRQDEYGDEEGYPDDVQDDEHEMQTIRKGDIPQDEEDKEDEFCKKEIFHSDVLCIEVRPMAPLTNADVKSI